MGWIFEKEEIIAKNEIKLKKERKIVNIQNVRCKEKTEERTNKNVDKDIEGDGGSMNRPSSYLPTSHVRRNP